MRQRLGQHFLRDPKVIQTILSAAELDRSEEALEIGPGKGILTGALAPCVSRLVAVELDDGLAEELARRFARSHCQIVHEDFLKTDLNRLFPDAAEHPVKILGNLPYSVASLILEKILPWPGWRTGVFLVQREVAERMASAPGGRSFGILSLAVQLFAEIEPVLKVMPGAFQPPPKVESMVIRLRRKPQAAVPQELIGAFFDLAHGAFAHRRKTIGNSLAMHAEIPKPRVENWLREQGIDSSRRAETLGTPEYARLTQAWANFRQESGSSSA